MLKNRLTSVRECNYIFERTTTIVYNDHAGRAEEHSTIAGNSVRPVGSTFSIDYDGTVTPCEPVAERAKDPFDPPQRSEIRYAYQYDEHDNWTEQTANYGLDSDVPSAVRRRKLTYY